MSRSSRRQTTARTAGSARGSMIGTARSEAKRATIYSDPRAELAVDNAKYVRLCKELYLGGRSIEALRGFDPLSI